MKSALNVTLFLLALVGWVPSSPAQISTGTQYLDANTPEGQNINFVFAAGGHVGLCGIHVKRLAYKMALNSKGEIFWAVKELKVSNNTMECGYDSKGKHVSKTTTFSGVEYSSGLILMTITAVPLAKPNERYQLQLTPQHQSEGFMGTMMPLSWVDK